MKIIRLHIDLILDKEVGLEVLTEAVMKSTIFWYIKPCNPLKVNSRFRGTYHLHIQGQRISQARYQCESRRYIPPKHQLTFNGLHGVISQKLVLFTKRNLSFGI
jgi:hypothetical protein